MSLLSKIKSFFSFKSTPTRIAESSTWTALNPILDKDEVGYDSTKGNYKIGDGKTNWNNLSYRGKQ
jgi:hypothetical protein